MGSACPAMIIYGHLCSRRGEGGGTGIAWWIKYERIKASREGRMGKGYYHLPRCLSYILYTSLSLFPLLAGGCMPPCPRYYATVSPDIIWKQAKVIIQNYNLSVIVFFFFSNSFSFLRYTKWTSLFKNHYYLKKNISSFFLVILQFIMPVVDFAS